MPTWAATHSLLLSNAHGSFTRTNTEIIAPLFKTSPTDITTLYTVLMLTQGISAVIVSSERKTILTFDLDLYNHALQTQQAVRNTNCFLRTGVLHIVALLFTLLAKQLMVVDLIHVQLKKAYSPRQLYVEFMVAKRTNEE